MSRYNHSVANDIDQTYNYLNFVTDPTIDEYNDFILEKTYRYILVIQLR